MIARLRAARRAVARFVGVTVDVVRFVRRVRELNKQHQRAAEYWGILGGEERDSW